MVLSAGNTPASAKNHVAEGTPGEYESSPLAFAELQLYAVTKNKNRLATVYPKLKNIWNIGYKPTGR